MTSFQKMARMLGCLLVLSVATTWIGCSSLDNNLSSTLPQADTAKLKKEVSSDPFPSAAQSGVAFASDQ